MAFHEILVNSDVSGDGTGQTGLISGYISRAFVTPHGSAGGSMTVTIKEVSDNDRTLWSKTTGSTAEEFTPTQSEVDDADVDQASRSLIRVNSRLSVTVASAGSALTPAVTVQFYVDEV